MLSMNRQGSSMTAEGLGEARARLSLEVAGGAFSFSVASLEELLPDMLWEICDPGIADFSEPPLALRDPPLRLCP